MEKEYFVDTDTDILLRNGSRNRPFKSLAEWELKASSFWKRLLTKLLRIKTVVHCKS